MPDQDWPGANGTYDVAACQSLEPVSYLGNGRLLGFDIEMLLLCAEELDVHLNFQLLEFSDVLSYMQSGKSDLGCGSILITQERTEAMDFVPTHGNNLILVVRSAGVPGDLVRDSSTVLPRASRRPSSPRAAGHSSSLVWA